MNIINSDIINTGYDVFWDDISSVIKDAPGRPVLILINKYDKDSQEEVQLLRMIDACQLKPEQYNIVQLKEEEKAAWHQLSDKLDPKFIFLIGIHPVQLGISALFALNVPNNFNDRVWLPTLSINDLEKFKDTKKQLWVNGISPIFIHKQFGDIT